MFKELIYDSGKASEEDLIAVNRRIGSQLPTEYNEFCFIYNGAKLKDAKIEDPKGNEYEVRLFINVHNVGISNVEFWDQSLVAIAEDSGGNYFVFQKPTLDAVYYWDHETDDLCLVCKTFSKFLSSIEKDDHSDIPKPVNARGWINPKFFELQKKLGNVK